MADIKKLPPKEEIKDQQPPKETKKEEETLPVAPTPDVSVHIHDLMHT